MSGSSDEPIAAWVAAAPGRAGQPYAADSSDEDAARAARQVARSTCTAGAAVSDSLSTEVSDEAQHPSESDEGVFEVDSVLSERLTRGGRVEFLLRWQGYGPEHDSWVPKADISPDLVAQFRRLRRQAKSQANACPVRGGTAGRLASRPSSSLIDSSDEEVAYEQSRHQQPAPKPRRCSQQIRSELAPCKLPRSSKGRKRVLAAVDSSDEEAVSNVSRRGAATHSSGPQSRRTSASRPRRRQAIFSPTAAKRRPRRSPPPLRRRRQALPPLPPLPPPPPPPWMMAATSWTGPLHQAHKCRRSCREGGPAHRWWFGMWRVS